MMRTLFPLTGSSTAEWMKAVFPCVHHPIGQIFEMEVKKPSKVVLYVWQSIPCMNLLSRSNWLNPHSFKTTTHVSQVIKNTTCVLSISN